MVIKSIGLKVLILPLSLALVVMISILFIKPALEDMNANRKALDAGKEKLVALQEQAQKLSELKNTFQSMEERKIVAVALPEDESIEDYLNELYQRASRSGVLVNNFSASEKAPMGGSSYVCGSSLAGVSDTSSAASSGSGTGSENLSGSNSAVSGGSLVPASCVQGSVIQISVKGTWDQFLSFYKYLADSNRIANVSEVSIGSKSQGSAESSESDLLESQVTLEVYYKSKSRTSNMATIGALTGGAGFNKNILKKLEEIVYAPYEAPAVSESSERNIFK